MTHTTTHLNERVLLGTNRVNEGGSANSFTIRNLSYAYNGLQVFREFSLESPSKIIILRGPSGCGKTTLLKLLSGNLQPDSFDEMPEPDRSCLILQEDSLLPWLTGTDNICKFIRRSPTEVMSHPMFPLVAGFVERRVHKMSYGQRRLVELFRAVAHRPEHLYLDEPFNFLDEENMGKVVPFVQELASSGTTIVLSNHHQEDLSMIRCAQVYKFDGRFPVQSISEIGGAQ